MLKIFSILGIISVLLPQPSAFAYDLSHRSARKSAGSTTVALIPYAESFNHGVGGLIKELRHNLQRQKGVRVLDQDKTQGLLNYYLTYVERTAADREVHRVFSEARQHIAIGDDDKAAQLLEKTRQLTQQRISSNGSNEGLYELYLLEAKLNKSNNKPISGSYDQVVALYPDLTLDKNIYSRWELKELAAAKARLAAKNSSSLEIISDPRGSEVFINGVHRGITPFKSNDFPTGTHCVEIKTVNHVPYLRYVSVGEDHGTLVKADLQRVEKTQFNPKLTIKPSVYQTDLEISRLTSTLGYHLGVDKVFFVGKQSADGQAFRYRAGDTALAAAQSLHEVSFDPENPKQTLSMLVGDMKSQTKADILKNPKKYANQSVGSIQLHEQRKTPLYKKPLFWVLVGATAAAGGIIGALVAGSGTAASATASGVFIGF